jgi:hypothetical protein
VVALGVITAVSVFLGPETRGRSLDEQAESTTSAMAERMEARAK